MRIITRIVGIEGVANGASVRVKLPVNRRYHGLKFFTTSDGSPAAADTDVDRVRCFVNGKTIRDLTAARVLKIAQLNGITPATGELPIHFSEPWRADKIDEQITAWDTFGAVSFEVELVLKDISPAVPGVSGFASYDFGQTLIDGKQALNIIKQFEQTKNATAGDNDFDNLVTVHPIQRVLLDAAQTINSVEVTADDNKVYEVTKAQNARLLADNGLDSTAVEFPVVFDHTERIADALVVAKAMNLRFNLATAAAVTAIMETRAPGYV